MTLWRARDVYRVQSTGQTLLALVGILELTLFAAHGAWYVGLVLVTVQGLVLWGLWRLLCWGLLWLNRGVYWCLDTARDAVRAWWARRRACS